MRIFKKRILMFDLMGCGGGTKTFLMNWILMIDSMDIALDIINLSPANKRGLNEMKHKFDNIGVIYQAAELYPELYKENTLFKNELTFFGAFVKNNIFEHIQQKMFHYALHENLYDFVFINHSECIAPVANTLNFSSIFKTFIYTHCGHVFTSYDLYKGKYSDIASKYIIDSVNNHGNIDVITQRKNSYVDKTFKTNHLIIGMPLNIEEIFSHHKNSKKEDKVLYLGRSYDGAKNIRGFIDTIMKTEYSAVFIVPEVKDRDKINVMCEEVGFNNFEVYYGLSQAEKYKISSKCKVCYMPSFTENFPFVAYENLNLMCVVADRREWSEEIKETLKDIYLADIDNQQETIHLAMTDYTAKKIVNQHKFLLEYNDTLKKQWSEYLLTDNLNVENSTNKDTKFAVLLNEKHTLQNIFQSEKKMDFTQFFALYKNIDWGKVVQTKEITLYNIDNNDVDEFFDKFAKSDVDQLF